MKLKQRTYFIIFICFLSLIINNGCAVKKEMKESNTAALDDSNTSVVEPTHLETTTQQVPLNVTVTKDPSPEGSPEALQFNKEKVKVKGIYVSGWIAGGKKLQSLMDLIDSSDLNAMVIDVKNDTGQVTFDSDVPEVNEIGADSTKMIPALKGMLQVLKSKNIYTIARIVTFKDPYLSNKKPEYGLHKKSGEIWLDKKGVSWTDPFNENVWNYNIAIAKEAVNDGFDEIQFDYVRFPENGKMVDEVVNYNNPSGYTKARAIQLFLRRAKEQIGNDVNVSADVFGNTTSSNDDMGIGQDWAMISPEIDYISPMVYPSHYSNGAYGIKYPNLQPYVVINRALTDAIGKNGQLNQTHIKTARIRPWYQDFTATWVKPHKKYGILDVNEQIKAAKELGIEEFLLWNSNCTYSYK